MITLPTKMPTVDEITNFIKWPIQEKENAIRTAIPVVTLVASKMFTNLSSFFSLVLAAGVCAGTEIINHQIDSKKNTPSGKAKPQRVRRGRQPTRRTPLQAMQALVNEDQSQKTELKRIKEHCVPLGKLLSSREYYDNKGFFEMDMALAAFSFFNITSNTIDKAWRKHPNTEDYKSRLYYLNTQANEKFQENFKNLKKVFEALVNKKNEGEVLNSIKNDRL